MRQKADVEGPRAEAVIKSIRPAACRQSGAAEKIRILLEGLRGQEPIAARCRCEGIAKNLYDFPLGALEARTEKFVDHYNRRRLHESCDNLTPAAVYFGRALPKAIRSQVITGSDPA